MGKRARTGRATWYSTSGKGTTWGWGNGVEWSRTVLIGDVRRRRCDQRSAVVWEPVEHFDELHPARVADGTADHGLRFVGLRTRFTCGRIDVGRIDVALRFRAAQQATAGRQLLTPLAVRQNAVMADPHEAVGQHV